MICNLAAQYGITILSWLGRPMLSAPFFTRVQVIARLMHSPSIEAGLLNLQVGSAVNARGG